MSRQFLLRMLTIFVVGGGIAGVARAEDRKPATDGAKAERVQVQVIGEKVKHKGGGVVFRLGDSSDFWLGIALEKEDGRLEVEQVLPESPAAKAGIKPDDILLASGETALKEVAELQKLVQSSEGKPLSLKILRAGKEIVVEVKPERHKGVQTIVIGEGDEAGEGKEGDKEAKEQLQKRLQQLIEQARKQAAASKSPRAGGWQMLRAPNVASNAPFPDNLEVTIKKKGNKPARIKVRQDAQTWTVSENELDKLPEPIRGHVARMLPGRATAVRLMPRAPLRPGASLNPAPLNPAPLNRVPANSAPANQGRIGIFVAPAGGVPGQPLPGASVARPMSRENAGDLQKEIQQLKYQLHELQEQVEALRKK